MGEVRSDPLLVLFFVAGFSRDESLLDSLPAILQEEFGPIALVSERFDFGETAYYESTMGAGLKKQFFVFRDLAPGDLLPSWKLRSNELEKRLADQLGSDVARPVNLDPGYLDEAKLILASTKDHSHRIYLAKGIFAEMTLVFRNKRWQTREWTYPDYARPDFHAFFVKARDYLRVLRHREGSPP